jgi:hypothetical protein
MIVCMLNKNLLAYLHFTLKEQGFLSEFVKTLLDKACKAATVATSYKYKWDETAHNLVSDDDKKNEDVLKAYENVNWFKDEFGLLDRAKSKSYTAPEALFNLDGVESHITIHDRHQKPSSPPPTKKASHEKIDNNP